MANKPEVRPVSLPINLGGKTIIVTGAGRGIGRGIAVYLAKCGAKVTAIEYRKDRLTDILSELNEISKGHFGVLCDIANKDAVVNMAKDAAQKFGQIDGIVNNAQRFISVKDLFEISSEDLDVLFDSGVKGTLWGMQAVYPYMKKQGFGRIVNVASASGLRGSEGYGPYNASKEAIRALTRTAAREWAKSGIVVNCYCPASALHRSTPDDDPARKAAYKAMYENHPMGRDGDAETDIAPVVAFLCSEACQYMTGQTLMVDGGGFMFA